MTIISQMKGVGFAWMLINFGVWVVTGFGLFKLASSRGMKTPFIVFIPFLRDMMIGQMADDVCEYVDDPFEKFSNFKVGGSYAKSGIVYSLFFTIVSGLLSMIPFLAGNVVPIVDMARFGILLAIGYIVLCDYMESPGLATVIVGALGAGSHQWILAFCGYKDMGTLYSGGSGGYKPQPTVTQKPKGAGNGQTGSPVGTGGVMGSGMMAPPPAPPMPPVGGAQVPGQIAGQPQGGFGVPGAGQVPGGQMSFNVPPRPMPPMGGVTPVQPGFNQQGVPVQVPQGFPQPGFNQPGQVGGVPGTPGQMQPGVPGQVPGVQGGAFPQQGLRK